VNDEQYIRQLKRAYRSEVFGEAVYAMAARVARNAERRHKWQALCRLERRMERQLSADLARLGVSANRTTAQRWMGGALGVVTGLLPWRFTLTVLGMITKRSTPFFERLQSEGASRQGSSIAELGAHERAQSEFVNRELAGDTEHSLDDVQALLAIGIRSGEPPSKPAERRRSAAT
jgi:hypothetical protein